MKLTAPQSPADQAPTRVVPPAPRVSVIMPCYNHGRFVEEAVSSILHQTFADFELIVVDDASLDNSADLLRKLAESDLRLRVVFHDRNRGASRSRNDGLRIARGEYVAFCDADDVWNENKLERQIETLTRHPEADIAYCASEIIDESSQSKGCRFSDLYPPPSVTSGNLLDVLCLRNYFNMQTVLLRRSALENKLFFDERIKWVEDWWFLVQLSGKHKFQFDEEPLAKYRVHSKSTSVTQRRGYHINRFRVYKRILERYPNLARQLSADIWYHMAIGLLTLGFKKVGRNCLWVSLRLELGPRVRLRHCARIAAGLAFGIGRCQS